MAWKEQSTLFVDLEEGDAVVGIFAGVDMIKIGEQDKPVSRYNLVVKDQARVSFLGGTALDRTFRERKIATGSLVKVLHCGSKELRDGKRCNLFRVWTWEGDAPGEADDIELGVTHAQE